MHSTSVTHRIHMGFQRCFSFSLSPSLPLYPILSASTLFPSHVPVSLTSRAYFDWGQTLGFHTIYNAALSNGIEYERGWNEHMLEKWRSNTMPREEQWPETRQNGKSKRKIWKIDFICTNLYVCVYIYIIKSSRIRSIFWKINDRSYSMNNSFLPSPRANRANNCFVRRYRWKIRIWSGQKVTRYVSYGENLSIEEGYGSTYRTKIKLHSTLKINESESFLRDFHTRVKIWEIASASRLLSKRSGIIISLRVSDAQWSN